jgi:thiazole synthase
MTVAETLIVRVNGEQRRLPGQTTITAMLGELGLDPARVAVERNLEIVPRSTFGEVRVEDGDSFEIVHFVGGG